MHTLQLLLQTLAWLRQACDGLQHDSQAEQIDIIELYGHSLALTSAQLSNQPD